jgi:hypothetical protein
MKTLGSSLIAILYLFLSGAWGPSLPDLWRTDWTDGNNQYVNSPIVLFNDPGNGLFNGNAIYFTTTPFRHNQLHHGQ